ncbi:MAG TPA: pseudouridine synthase [Opitutaceae bacterium]|nr:pseudouridine synthase [Opitutaceae bacterium]
MRRLDQILANLGYGSRREARALIEAGRVTVAGAVETDPGAKAAPRDVSFDGTALEFTDGILIAMHKPAGCVCSHDSGEGRRIYDLLPPRWLARNPVPTTVGRLDKDTTGVLIVTDDMPLVHRLVSPKHKLEKVYEATLDAEPDAALIATFASGALLLVGEKDPCAPATLVLKGGREVELTLTEGRFHQVKRMFAHFGLVVTRLHRSRFGPITVDGLAPGQWRELSREEIS